MDCDVLVIGGGIVGLATARELLLRNRQLRVIVLEKEAALASHQTGRNSGVIHAGVYYAPGSLKAKFCRQGVSDTIAFCKEHGIAYEQCGKLLVATDEPEMARMVALQQRCGENGIDVERLDAQELRRREPHIRGLGALFVASTGIVNYARITEAMAAEITSWGSSVITSTEVTGISEHPDHVLVRAGDTQFRARQLIACAGVMADKMTSLAGIETGFRIVPFRGEYFRLAPRHDQIVQHLIYPIPDPALPFLGVHLTRMIGGYVTVGPNAVLAFAREGYRFWEIDARHMAEMLAFPGFRKTIVQNLGSGLREMRNSLSRTRYLALCQKYCPELQLDDLQPYRPGIRAQAVLPDGTLAHDFMIEQTERMLHVCNAPSPAATSAMPIARHIVDLAAAKL